MFLGDFHVRWEGSGHEHFPSAETMPGSPKEGGAVSLAGTVTAGLAGWPAGTLAFNGTRGDEAVLFWS